MNNKRLILFCLSILVIGVLIYIGSRNPMQQMNQWEVKKKMPGLNETAVDQLVFLSPRFEINEIYRSMKGPISGHPFLIDSSKAEVVWITGYGVEVTNEDGTRQLPDDFICHSNLDFDLTTHRLRWQVNNDTNDAYPRLFTLTQGQTGLSLPKGFGFPVFSDEPLGILTQVLNHNLPDTNLMVRHRIRVDYVPHQKVKQRMKPVFERSIFVMLPFDENSSKQNEVDPKSCVPVDPKNHRYLDAAGATYSGHWFIQPGKSQYRYNVTKMMNLPAETKLHYVGVHTHPFARELKLIDLTNDSVIFNAKCSNFEDKIGLRSLDLFSSEKGIPVYPSHEYELTVDVENTSDETHDMMASMFLYFYDPLMDQILLEQH